MKLKLSSLMVGSLLLLGCQTLENQQLDYWRSSENDYLNSRLIAPLKLPEGFKLEKQSNYPIPSPLPQPGSIHRPSLVPPGFGEFSK